MKLLDRRRHDVDRVGGVRIRGIEAVIHLRSALHGSLQPRLICRVGDLLAIQICAAPVLEGFLVMLAGHHVACTTLLRGLLVFLHCSVPRTGALIASVCVRPAALSPWPLLTDRSEGWPCAGRGA